MESYICETLEHGIRFVFEQTANLSVSFWAWFCYVSPRAYLKNQMSISNFEDATVARSGTLKVENAGREYDWPNNSTWNCIFAGMSPLPGCKLHCVIPYVTYVSSVAVRLVADYCTPLPYF